MTMMTIDDFPDDLLPINETRKCDRCGAWTWWATARQKTKGRCLTCVSGSYSMAPSSELFDRIIDSLTDAFPGSTVTFDWTPPRYRPGAYRGPDAGPCVRCGQTVCRYGPNGYPSCTDCEPLSRREPGC